MASALSYQTDRPLDVADAHGEAIDEKKSESSRLSVTGVSFVEGSESVTHEELATLRHLPDSIPFAAFLVVVVEFAERWTYYGESYTVSEVVHGHSSCPRLTRSRLQGRLPCGETTFVLAFHPVRPPVRSPLITEPTVSPALLGVACKLPSLSAISTFSGSTLLPSWAGILPTVTWAVIKRSYASPWSACEFNTSPSKRFHQAYMIVLRIGHIILVGTSVPSSLAHPDGALAGLIVSIVIMGIGAGSIKANVSPMIAEQYTGKLRKKTLPSGEVVLISPALTYQRIYMCMSPRYNHTFWK